MKVNKSVFVMMIVAAVVMMGCANPMAPVDPEPELVEISALTLQRSATCTSVSSPVPNGAVWSDTGVTSNGIVWTVESVYLHDTEPGFRKIFKAHTNKYESGSTEQVTWYVSLHFDGSNWSTSDLKGDFGPCGNWTDAFVAYANTVGFTIP